ncbi:MAG: transglycosylase SLT domain-containing protein [Burkholderiaceae bacterium]|jgi:soluble lytic murein transglycosylase-like protein|nr:transglycosylase SLT domain-containing protein [Burkholderiaceae bacterium]MEB2319266.1 transglycosylase SLT domain-containing protein [Pseudomonadota bacterium]
MNPASPSRSLSPRRRFARACALALAAGLLVGAPALAGQQQYEPLADSVRSAMSASLAGGVDMRAYYESDAHRDDWLAQMAVRLPRRWIPDDILRIEFLEAVRYEAQRAGLDPALVLGLIQVESNFRQYAVSSAGARGLMQVMPFWTRLIGDGDESRLFDMRTNLRYGCTILRHYIDIERGDLFRALGRYNGSLGRAPYPQAVRRAWDRWRYDPTAGETRTAGAGSEAEAGAGAG